MGSKLLRNKTGYDIKVTLIVRQGSEPGHIAGTVDVNLKKGEQTKKDYGSQPFLDGLEVFFANVNGASSAKKSLVVVRGSQWDDTLNTNDTLDIGVRPGLNVTGSNTWT